ncbi:hypothetical protein NMG60_11030851 [Bertholletia excelsa]
MARQIVVLALLLVALVGAASAASLASDLKPMPAMSPSESQAASGAVGTLDGPETDAAPVGAPVPVGSFTDLAPSPSSATTLQISAAIGVAATIATTFFF